MNLSIEKRFSNYWAARVSYALGYARGDSEPNQQFTNTYQVLDQVNLNLNEGPLNNDRKQNFVLSGRVRGAAHRRTDRQRHLPLDERPAVHADQLQRGRRPQRTAVRRDPGGHYCGIGAERVLRGLQGRTQRCARPELPEDRPADDAIACVRRKGTTVDLTFELFNIFNNWNFERPGRRDRQNWYSDQRLTDFLTLTQFTGGNGQPRAAQFSARLGF